MTPSNEVLAAEAETLTREIEGGLLAFASPEARDEWAMFRGRWTLWRTDRRDEPFEMIVQRLRRFQAILKGESERLIVAARA